jgi:hypothetical protein
MNKLFRSAALALALTPSLAGDAVAAKSFQFMFINHTNMQLHFYTDEAYACTANAGMVCYSHMAVGPHTVRAAMGSQTLQEFSFTLHENAQSPGWTVCNSDTGTCPLALTAPLRAAPGFTPLKCQPRARGIQGLLRGALAKGLNPACAKAFCCSGYSDLILRRTREARASKDDPKMRLRPLRNVPRLVGFAGGSG